MKVLFLDVDGVLNQNRAAVPGGDRRLLKTFVMPEAMERLNKIWRATGAMVVVSSTWRIGKMRTELAEGFRDAGYEGLIYGKTEVLGCSAHEGLTCSQGHRGAEIGLWLIENIDRVDGYAILDDGSDMGILLPYLVKTDGSKGLQDKDVDAVIEKLGKIEV